ncbi:hypothetical protein GLOIN_2v283090 [Rhizophagus irregularis DAOM 181602=DAOM 197198]|uniref:Uncharacterized protein n=1 Tax=Rhizophagus irregularis (strain DAOM 181602 / DAOM 197198 / MUCL 43194) TaxID=747089 RepID=A0A2P4QSE3_RHIID|nr:hypothetical protein GLOIN_2v283090 [Rhizophagus irregularis DAOM 181602=DAOM 197198]POG80561.1 hypothetical protein GLOIN_2v283090 [Rhizophagus irregularis DAOM 181602=DAOM 197198]|eukprot:XP_025187427.1 hypothetical protein GLOIN_2v283090 [Rhizophagus irregularis DAOM 181602=DAOM 197198]
MHLHVIALTLTPYNIKEPLFVFLVNKFIYIFFPLYVLLKVKTKPLALNLIYDNFVLKLFRKRFIL